MTDELASDEGLKDDYLHQTVNDSQKQYVVGHVHTNSMENFWTLFERCLKGTYVSVEGDHLFRYLNEEMFRFNERKGKDQHRFVKAAKGISGRRLTYKQLIDRGGALFPRRGRLPKLVKEQIEK